MSATCDVIVISDFNAELTGRYLSADASLPKCTATSAPYGQVFQTLADVSGRPSKAVSRSSGRGPKASFPNLQICLAASRSPRSVSMRRSMLSRR